jgi:hypothetical protein
LNKFSLGLKTLLLLSATSLASALTTWPAGRCGKCAQISLMDIELLINSVAPCDLSEFARASL